MLGRLLDIQEMDIQIGALEARAARIPKLIDALDSTVANEIRAVEECKAKRVSLEKQRDAVELDIDTKTELLHKWEVQLFAIKTNKEYQAMLVEIGSIKTDISLLEDRMLELMDQIEQANEELTLHKDALAAAHAKKESKEQELLRELDDLNAEIDAIKARRNPLVSEVDENIYNLYERIRRAKGGGRSVVPLDDTTCGGCHMQVPAQTINEIIANDKVHTCRTCSRILYYPDNYPSSKTADLCDKGAEEK